MALLVGTLPTRQRLGDRAVIHAVSAGQYGQFLGKLYKDKLII